MAAYELVRDGSAARYLDTLTGTAVEVAHGDKVRLVQPPPVVPAPASAIFQALAAPAEAPPLWQLAQGRRRVAIITSDSTRSVPCAALLDEVVPELTSAGVLFEDITVVVAVGAHRPATRVEMDAYLGAWVDRLTIMNHDAFDPAALTNVGRTSDGNEVRINRTVAEADLRIAFGQVEPHEFAGFSGGPKSILAGVSGEESIKHNHSPRMLLDPRALPGITEGNPIWEEMLEAARAADVHFIVNVVLTPELEIAGVVAGSLEAAHRLAIDLYRRTYSLELPAPGSADIVVTTPGHPLDRNLYQCVKALVAVQHLVRPGGVVVLYGACDEGIGGDPFVEPFDGATSPEEVIDRLGQEGTYKIEMDHSLLLCRMQVARGLRFVLCTPGVAPDVVRSMFCEVASTAQEAYDRARSMVDAADGNEPRTLFYPKPQKVAPRVALR